MADADIQRFKEILIEHGYRVTLAREATFKLLINPRPQSINEILLRAKGSVDRVSVYRNIELFEQLGIAHRIYIGWKYKLELSDEFMAHHHHLSCLKCGKVIDIEDETHINEFITRIAAEAGFTPRRHQFEVDGYCRDCQTQANNNTTPRQ